MKIKMRSMSYWSRGFATGLARAFLAAYGEHVALNVSCLEAAAEVKHLFYPTCTESLDYRRKAIAQELNPAYSQWF